MKCTFIVATALAGAITLLAGCHAQSPATRVAEASESSVTPARQTAPVDDAVLAARLRELLHNDPTTSQLAIQIAVDARRVRLSGFVDTAAAKLRAGVLATRMEGIEAVDNRLILRHRADISSDPIGEARVHL